MKTVLAVAVLAAASALAGTIVIPTANTATEGTGADDIGYAYLGGAAETTQMFIPASFLSGIPTGDLLTGLAFRLDSSASTGPSSTLNWTNLDIVVSQPSGTYTSTLGTLFSSNLGGDATTVRSGAFSVNTNDYSGNGSPNAFGPFITFTTPYLYTGTDLLIQFRSTGSGGADLVLDADTAGIGTEYYNGNGYTATTGNSSIGRVPVTEFQFTTAGTTVPEPASLGLVLLGGALLLAKRVF
jgi:hypothetical protein